MKKYFIILISLVFIVNLQGQDISFSQYINTLLYLNPSFAGSSGNRFAYTARMQERTLPQNAPSFNFSYDHLIRTRNTSGTLSDTHSNIGISGIWDNQGLITSPSARQTLVRFYNLSLAYAYRIDLKQNYIIQLGINGGYLFRQFGNTELNFPNQFVGTGFNTDGGGEAFTNDLVGSPDFGFGAVLATPSYWVSYSASHVTRPIIGFLNTNAARLPFRHTIAAGYKWQFIRRFRSETNPKVYIKPSFVFHYQSSSRQIIIGNNVIYLPVSLGIWYRGSNFFTDLNKIGQDALVFMVGLRFPLGVGLFSMHYSYDLPLPRRTAINSNAVSHEFSIVYEFRKIEKNACPNPWR